jgi:aryl-alcohol dehydrogenase-like predicted oxidoreductase
MSYEKRQLGSSEVYSSVIAFGAWAIGGWSWRGADRKDAIEVAYDHGVTSINTATAYGQDLSEEITGEAIHGIYRQKVQLLTKFGLRRDTTADRLYFKSKDNPGRDINIHYIKF